MAILLVIDAEPEEQAQWRLLLQAALPGESLVEAPADDVDIAIVANPPPGALSAVPRLR